MSGGLFLTPRNLWNLSVQSATVAIMATGMVLIIVSRNIDLSVGSVLAFTGMVMAMIQTEWLPTDFGLGFGQPYTWIIALAVGLALGALIGLLQGFIIAYIGVPSFIVTLGGLLVWRGLAFEFAQGQTISPARQDLPAAGRRARGVARRDTQLGWSAASPASGSSTACRESPATAEVRLPGPADVGRGHARGRRRGAPSSARSGSPTATPGRRRWPPSTARARTRRSASPIRSSSRSVVAFVMTIVATRRRFGRYVFAIGGNPDAAELGGINTRRTIMLTFVIMSMLAAVSAAVLSARLNAGDRPDWASRASCT